VEFAAAPPALLHGQRLRAAAATAALAARFRRPCLQTVHDRLRSGGEMPVASPWLKGVIVPSPTVGAEVARQARLPVALIRMVPAGVELSEAPAPGVAAATRVVGMASSLEPDKGGLYFLLAAKALLDQGRPLEFLIAGTGEDEGLLRRAARKLGIAPRVTFAGHVSDYLGLLRTIDLFVSPSLREGLGAALLEAMALGRPVVATQVGSLADFFADGKHLLFAPPADHAALAAGVGACLDDPVGAAARAAAARELARREFNADTLVARTAEAYRAALAEAQ
jgi:glycosyltransferase involved in cell wall biosynthesis